MMKFKIKNLITKKYSTWVQPDWWRIPSIKHDEMQHQRPDNKTITVHGTNLLMKNLTPEIPHINETQHHRPDAKYCTKWCSAKTDKVKDLIREIIDDIQH